MRRMLKAMLRRAGWELRRTDRTPPAPPMTEALLRLRTLGLEVNTVLDVGASNGCWSRECLNAFPQAHYVLFEPQPAHHADLDQFARSCKQSVTVVRKAVGGAEGRTFFDASDPFGGALAQRADGGHTIEVDLTTIDASASQLGLKGPFLLKLDTHGFERSILEGARGTLPATNALVIEAYNHRITPETLLFWELCAFLSDRGFRPIDLIDVMRRRRDQSLWQMNLFFIRSAWEGFNVVSYQ